VWILAEGIWTQKLSLSQQSAAGLSTEELAKALSFEVEPLSGIPADQSMLGVVEASAAEEGGEGRDYWVVQMPEQVVAELAGLVHRAGGKLSAIGHPGGLGALVRPVAATGKTDEESGGEDGWRRIEVWPQATLFVTGGGGHPGRVHIINGSSDQPSWQRWVQRWVNSTNAAHSEWMGDLDPELYLPSEALPEQWLRVGLGGEADTGAFLQTWMRHLAAEIPGVPLVRPRPRKAVRRDFVRLGVALELVVALLVGTHAWGLTWYQRQETARKTDALGQARELNDLKDQITKTQSQMAGLEAARSTDTKPDVPLEKKLEHLRTRLFHTITKLGTANPPGLVLERITKGGGSGELVVQGLALEPDLPDRYAVSLNHELRGDGVAVTPAEKTGRGWSGNGGPWSFSITISIQPLNPSTKPASSTRPTVHVASPPTTAGGTH
jgi:hypothetical protein